MTEWENELEDFSDDYSGPCECGVIGCEECDAEFYEEHFDCGMMGNGQCTKAGSEECDFECPNRWGK